jgi:quercetin dioxygenase-like cupin family protein
MGRLTVTRRDDATLYRLPGREWRLVLGPQNSGSERMTMAIASLPPGSSPGTHVHELEDEVVYVLSGAGRLLAPSGPFDLVPGVAFHMPAGIEHGAETSGEALELLCVFTPPVVPGSYDPLEE